MFRNICLIFLGILFVLEPGPTWPLDPIPRKVMVLYDSKAGQSERENLIYQNARMILNHFGMLPEFRDINSSLPDDRFMGEYRGVITVFLSNIQTDPGAYLKWLIRQSQAKRKIVIIGLLGVRIKPDSPADMKNRLHDIESLLGFRNEGDFTVSQPLLRYARKDIEGVEFERQYPPYPQIYEKIGLLDKSARVYLSIQRTDKSESTSAVIFTNRAGGFAYPEFIYWQDPVTLRRQWHLNPFLFFKEALGAEGLPAPDPTTLNGLRVAFSHIDADGFSGPSRINKKKICAEIIRDKILKIYPFPVTVSVIVGEIDPGAPGSPEIVEVAKEIFRLPNVEPASHSYSHPFYWDPTDQNEAERYDSQYGISIPGYTYDPKMEIDFSMQYITENLAPPGKPARVLLWSGNCRPRESDIARTDALGFLNMNGGDTLYDHVFNSLTTVSPFYRKVGDRYQIYTGQANENILTNLWKGPYYGFRNITTTMERTGTPRRLAPIDIYYHFYSGEYPASLKALEDVYEWALHQEIAPVFTSQYIEMVHGFLSAKMFRDGPERYVIRDYAKCLTVRFDEIGKLPDLSRSFNVAGFSVEPQGLYVSLKPGTEEAIIVFSDPPNGGKPFPYVQKASGWVTRFEAKESIVRIEYSGFGNGKLKIAGLSPNGTYALSGNGLNGCVVLAKSDDKGVLSIDCLKTGSIEITW